ncbi:MAG: hypothetical protein RSB11_06655 [Oscillospiraceae bacterium]
MSKKKIRTIASWINVSLIAIYFIAMLILGQGSILDSFFIYFLMLGFIFGRLPIAINEDTQALCDSERKIRMVLGSLAFASVLIPAIVFLCSGMEAIRQLTLVTNFWRFYPCKIVAVYLIIDLVVMIVYRHRRKNKEA